MDGIFSFINKDVG